MNVDYYVSNFQFQKLSDRERHQRELLKARNDLLQKGLREDSLSQKAPLLAPNQNPIHIPPLSFVHIQNTSKMEEGPQTLTLLANEKLISGPTKMISLLSNHYCVIKHPVVRNNEGIEIDPHGHPRLRHEEEEVRVNISTEHSNVFPLPPSTIQMSEPFGLYPGELLSKPIQSLPVLQQHNAIRLRATREFSDEFSTPGSRVQRVAEEEWLVPGPRIFVPHPAVTMVAIEFVHVIKSHEALRVRAHWDMIDRHGNRRVAGEEWLETSPGTFLPSPSEEIVEKITPVVLSHGKALHLRALHSCLDALGKSRKAGEEWLVFPEDSPAYLPSIHEEVVGVEEAQVVPKGHVAQVRDSLGRNRIEVGEIVFFLQPGEVLEGIARCLLLGPEESVRVQATEEVIDPTGTKRLPGERWMIYGPCQVVPALEWRILDRWKAFFRWETFGLYFFYWFKQTL